MLNFIVISLRMINITDARQSHSRFTGLYLQLQTLLLTDLL
jgi:hypothetical protein